jgi:hypothetical protein
VQSITCNHTGKPFPCATLHTLTMILSCEVAQGPRQVGVLCPPKYDMNFQLQPGTLEAFAMLLQFLQQQQQAQLAFINIALRKSVIFRAPALPWVRVLPRRSATGDALEGRFRVRAARRLPAARGRSYP